MSIIVVSTVDTGIPDTIGRLVEWLLASCMIAVIIDRCTREYEF